MGHFKTKKVTIAIVCLVIFGCVNAGITKVGKKPIFSKEKHQKPKVELTKTAETTSTALPSTTVATTDDTNLSQNVSITTEAQTTTIISDVLDISTTGITSSLNEEKESVEKETKLTTAISNDIAESTLPMTTTAPNTIASSTSTTALPETTIHSNSETKNNVKTEKKSTSKVSSDIPCTCGVFLSSQFTKGSQEAPSGEAVIHNSVGRTFQCNGVGQKQCQTKCLEQIVQHLPDSASILCASVPRDIRKERAYLFIKNCEDKWINTNLAAGREYCCKNREPYNCK